MDPYTSCIIEDLVLDHDPNKVEKMAIFLALFRQTQIFCLDHETTHLAITRRPGAHWYTGLLTQVGFQHCECDRPGELVARSPTCFPLDQISAKREKRGSSTTGSVAQHAGFSRLPNAYQVQSPIPRATSDPYDAPARSNNPGPPRKKVYCTFWIESGRCNYMQEGCRLKHEIPRDETTRNKIGMRGIPRWLQDDPVEFEKYWPTVPHTPIPATLAASRSNSNYQASTPQFSPADSPEGSVKRRRPVSGHHGSEPNRKSVKREGHQLQGREQSGRLGYRGATNDLEEGELGPQYAIRGRDEPQYHSHYGRNRSGNQDGGRSRGRK